MSLVSVALASRAWPTAGPIPRRRHGRLLVTMLAGIAEFERELIRARTGEGRKRAKARGVRFGRPPALHPTSRRKALSDREAMKRHGLRPFPVDVAGGLAA